MRRKGKTRKSPDKDKDKGKDRQMANKKSIPCKVILTSRRGYVATPLKALSIAEGIGMAKGSGFFRYRIVTADGRVARQGFCD